ncbi:EF-hand domain-containing protein [Streptomyces sp. NBC_01750]|uniref:EF-hand domain-containing protein n=1 Tax=Streptomyces sp. NBC_01750 TaxID=2975928 RepID=UPI002DDC7E22|nr:EF-hand domain-containing protein [Streptomyces sp. NBC_01750]WSD36829.1 EF-hand domain-containing protein [Streptomyces sp. NBC_01750]
MTTAVQKTRVQRRFELLDVDNNGKIDAQDFKAEAQRIVKAFKESEETPRGKAVIDAYLSQWSYLAQKAGIPEAGSLSPQQFADVGEEHMFGLGESGFSKVLRPAIQAIVNLVDSDGDGRISPSEFKVWLDAMGVDSSQAQDAFEQIDMDGDGQLSLEEMVEAVRRFVYGESDVPLLGR